LEEGERPQSRRPIAGPADDHGAPGLAMCTSSEKLKKNIFRAGAHKVSRRTCPGRSAL